ncbi:MAG: Mrp/NBP35 family ATP-binding protein [Myxococcota bacterium]|jgi:ATP-binding protein involved in chromosome partitioning|nr:Mrp/NBP35 family ATP-binding protein [Myxococcota bacterium]
MSEESLRARLLEALSDLSIDGQSQNLLASGVLRGVEIEEKLVRVHLLQPSSIPSAQRFAVEDAVSAALRGLVGERELRVLSAGQAAAPSKQAAPQAPHEEAPLRIEGVSQVIAVASAKGGVGKSTVAVNLALALARLGRRVGLLDLDLYGPSLQTLLGVREQPQVRGERLQPIELHGLRLMSLGFFVEEGRPVIWRGPMVASMVRQLIEDTDWGELDHLVIDLPPGTGDAQLTLIKTLALDGAIIVSTPSNLAIVDAVRGLEMFRTLHTPVLGLVENMSWFDWPGAAALRVLSGKLQETDPAMAAQLERLLERHERVYVFGQDAAAREAQRLEVPLLAQVPVDTRLRAGGDHGRPILLEDPDGQTSAIFLGMARAVGAIPG